MIHEKELRIGNWVNFIPDNGDFIVSSIDASNRLSKTINGLCPDDIKPIPLTDKILLKCGFEINKTHCTKWINDINTFIISERKNKTWFLCDTDVNTSFKYLHQLQNLYFALTQKELEIKFL